MLLEIGAKPTKAVQPGGIDRRFFLSLGSIRGLQGR
jgi:hypothetical protein